MSPEDHKTDFSFEVWDCKQNLVHEDDNYEDILQLDAYDIEKVDYVGQQSADDFQEDHNLLLYEQDDG